MGITDGLYVGGLALVVIGVLMAAVGGPIGLLLVQAGVVSVGASFGLPLLVAVILLVLTVAGGGDQQAAEPPGQPAQPRRPREPRQSTGGERLDLDTDSIEDYRR